MAEVFTYDPASEFEILEHIDFEEEIQRPEELRFFTLDEQLLDYFEKVLPKKKHITKFEYQKIADESDRIRELYNKTITLTDTDYTIDTSRKTYKLPWISPVYEDFEYVPYSFEDQWIPVNSKASRSTPNYYQTMIAALPRPFKSTGSAGTLISKFTVAVDRDGKQEIRAHGNYNRTKTVIHEDSRYSIVDVPIGNTNDDIRLTGFHLRPRGLPIPLPMEGHPFLASAADSTLITDQPLRDVFPTTEAIMTHAVPITEDPYGEGLKYLKIYDVALNQIPWTSWKDRFPPASMVSATPTILSVPFPRGENEPEPAKSLMDTYVLPWSVGMSPRLWLLSQEDGGLFVTRMLLSRAGDSGLVPPEPMGEKLEAQFPASTPDECFVIDTFDTFLNSGIYRNGKCVPSSFITQERSRFRYAGKSAWKETTESDILREHQKLLKAFQVRPSKPKEPSYEKYEVRAESDLRKQVRAILDDPLRTPEDMADSIGKIVHELTSKDHVFVDSNGSFVVCEHTQSILDGNLEKDRLKFYEQWTGIIDGFRSCKFCGEQINTDVFTAQDDFDEAGHLIVSHDFLPTTTFHGDSTANTFASSLKQLQPTFKLENTGESIFYLLLSVLQVLPEDSQLLPVLDNIRTLTAVLRTNKKISPSDKDRIEGVLGLVGMVVIMQTHTPFLLSRRSFGSRVLRFTGFPRDTEDPTKSAVLDTLISVLKSTFESFPFSFKGPSTAILRAILSRPKEIRKEAVVYIKQAYAKFRVQFDSAKQRFVETGEVEVQVPLEHLSKQEFKPTETLGDEQKSSCAGVGVKSILVARLPPSVFQKPIELWKNIQVSKQAFPLYVEEPTITKIEVSEDEIRRRIKLGFPKAVKLPRIEPFLRSNTDGAAFLALLNRILDILVTESFDLKIIEQYRKLGVYIETRTSAGLVRDATRGILYELLDTIQKDKNNSRFIQAIQKASLRDLVMNMILLNKEDAEKVDNGIRAREREIFKQRLRQMNDTEREITKMLLDIGIAPYLITNEDREVFSKEFNIPDPEEAYNQEQLEADEERPEEGYNSLRDTMDNGDDRVNDQGEVLETDYGDYGDRVERRYNGDYENLPNYDADEGYGV